MDAQPIPKSERLERTFAYRPLEFTPMTQFQPPLNAPDGSPYSQSAPVEPSYRPLPWSGLAIAALVCSLLGCLGFTAILGLIFAIAGILVTRGGHRRGRGLAVAAIPISIVMGFVSILLIYGVVGLQHLGEARSALATALRADDATRMEAIAGLRTFCSEPFNRDYSADDLAVWLDRVDAKHGSLVEIKAAERPVERGENQIFLDSKGKFINGEVPVRLTFTLYGLMDAKIDDIDVGGISPRRME